MMTKKALKAQKDRVAIALSPEIADAALGDIILNKVQSIRVN